MRTPRRTPINGAPPKPAPLARGRRAHAGPPAEEDHTVDDPSAPTVPPTRAAGRGLRPRTVRAKIVCLLMVPVVSLLALWAYATVTTAQDVARMRQLQRVDSTVRGPVADAVVALQAERTAAVAYAAKPAADRGDDLRKRTSATDKAVAKLRLGDGNTVADGADLPARVGERLSAFVTGTEKLRAVRSAVLGRRTGWEGAYGQYTKTIDSAFAVTGAVTGIQDDRLGSDARVLLEFSRSGEMLAREDSLLAAARLAGSLDGARLRLFTGAVDTRRTLAESAVADLPAPQRTAWRHLVEGSAYGDVHAVEDKALAARPGSAALAAAPALTWDSAHTTVQNRFRSIETDAARTAGVRADPITRGLLTPAGAAVLFGLLAVAASLVISVRIGRGLVIELISLRNRALEIARRKLPQAMRKLRAGEEIDVSAEAPEGPPAEDEIGQVAEALGTVHRAALRAAAERAELASGISGVFVNLARRSQVLVHRQLGLLDAMERRAEDPNELSDLFRLDHLTTRMRRHAESLIILSGAAPGRAWRTPVSLTNVVRAAVSEVEDYARVEVRQLPGASVQGAAVADLTHLLAELVENAAQFSPPHTKVRVSGEPVGNGYALEIEDRGLGMGKETLTEANNRIAHSEALDLFDSDRLGLFVVSRLAHRHGIKVHLRTSPYGGTTTVVLLPTPLLHAGTPERADTTQEHATEHHYARVPDPEAPHMNGKSVPAQGPRPAIAAAVHAVPDADTAHDAPPPPGVTALRLRRQPANNANNADDTDDESPDGLPKRVRQASLAPQLRERPEEQDSGAQHQEPDARTPEQARQRMAAFRDGWVRGGGRPPGAGSGPVPGRDSTEGDPT
ncbi:MULTISPECIES: ATP-binding protein [unclassified Streptomyces]|uniref:sensor histidine kinase n=1 Tax=unclassified Streptomyces TaxID=2593676 RepID=UPI002E2F3852|nr:ATP-binding protein [Streptomyces sp. NBC_01280]WSE13601.1 ATP-binding protein [Streptomyces sp. NBC_01397]